MPPTEDEINNASDAFGSGLSGMGDTLSNKYAERVDPLGQAVAGFASALGFGNSTTFGTQQPSTASTNAATPKITVGSGNGNFVSPTQVEGGYPYSTGGMSYEDARQAIYDKYGQWSGGPNAAVLRSLNQGIQQKNQQYKQNSSSVENMYGQLTQESESAKKSILDAYEQAIGATGQRASALQNVLSQEGAAQEARRAQRAAELGISEENALMQYGSQDRLNEAMGNILGQGQSWQGLLESQKLSARQQADRMKTAIGNTKSATQLSLTEAYQNAINNYKAQIAQEKSKKATFSINDEFGKQDLEALLAKRKRELDGGGGMKWRQDEAEKLDRFSDMVGRPVTSRRDPAYGQMLLLAQQAYTNATGSGGAITPEIVTFMDIFGLTKADLYPAGLDQFNPSQTGG